MSACIAHLEWGIQTWELNHPHTAYWATVKSRNTLKDTEPHTQHEWEQSHKHTSKYHKRIICLEVCLHSSQDLRLSWHGHCIVQGWLHTAVPCTCLDTHNGSDRAWFCHLAHKHQTPGKYTWWQYPTETSLLLSDTVYTSNVHELFCYVYPVSHKRTWMLNTNL